jgi:cation diffusion facilitator CzcD-associated flavoprotein CzcO
MPDYPGQFSGEFLHAHDFKSAAPFADKRVLVIGGGNSACDIAVETSRVSAFTAISMRRGYYIVPKFIMGLPTDVFNARVAFLPRWLRIPLSYISLRLAVGTPEQYGLQKPDHRILESHPTANSELLYFIRHGKIHPRRDIQRFDGRQVHFVDGKAEEYDVVVAATGFKITFPFFDQSLVDFSVDVPLFLRMFHPDHPSLMFIGLFQPQGAIWPLADLQAKLAANYIAGRYQLPADMRQQIAAEVQLIRRRYLNTPRHNTEIEYHPFERALQQAIPADVPGWDAHLQGDLPDRPYLNI